jgi:alcohol dehydrogenase (cytochrome c)
MGRRCIILFNERTRCGWLRNDAGELESLAVPVRDSAERGEDRILVGEKKAIMNYFVSGVRKAGFLLMGVALIARLCPPALAAAPFPAESADIFGFTQSQVEAGRSSYARFCSSCHGEKLDGAGAPALTGAAFLQRWASGTRPARDLYEAVNQMPKLAPHSLAKSQYIDITSYILAANGFAPTTAPASEATLHELLQASALPKENSPLVEQGEFPRPPSSIAQASQTSPTTAELAAPSDEDWLMYNRDYTGQRYSRLRQINVRNAAQLQHVCMLQLGVLSAFQSSPIIYRGVGYVTTTRLVHAFEAATCKLKWTYTYEVKGKENIPTNRGLAIYDGKLFRGTTDGHLLALDAANGTLLWDARIADSELGYFISAAPVVVGGRVIVGLAGSDFGVRGHVYAFDANTGRRLWTFNTIPTGDEPGAETWTTGTEHGGGGTWSTVTVDLREGLVFVPVTNPGPDFDASVRPGLNLYTNSVVALHVDTGKLAWYVQQVPGDTHDWDTAAAPILYEQAGRRYMAVASKDGWLYLYDRDSHALITRAEISKHENVDVPVTGTPVHICPGLVGGAEWNGPAYDPQSKSLFINSVDWCATIAMEHKPYVAGALYAADKQFEYDPIEDARGWLRALDGATGRQRWSYAAPAPMVAGLTPTAGGVVLTGGSHGEFLVFDASNGVILYRFNTGGAVSGGVSTYMVGARQYVAVASGNHGSVPLGVGGAPTVVVFALPKSPKPEREARRR